MRRTSGSRTAEQSRPSGPSRTSGGRWRTTDAGARRDRMSRTSSSPPVLRHVGQRPHDRDAAPAGNDGLAVEPDDEPARSHVVVGADEPDTLGHERRDVPAAVDVGPQGSLGFGEGHQNPQPKMPRSRVALYSAGPK